MERLSKKMCVDVVWCKFKGCASVLRCAHTARACIFSVSMYFVLMHPCWPRHDAAMAGVSPVSRLWVVCCLQNVSGCLRGDNDIRLTSYTLLVSYWGTAYI